jgi:hypothetical protein
VFSLKLPLLTWKIGVKKVGKESLAVACFSNQ